MKIKILQKIEKEIQRIRNKFAIHSYRRMVLQRYKYVHVMTNGIHSLGIIKFINKYFDNNEHCFIFPILFPETKEKIREISNCYNYQLKDIPLKKVKKIIFQGLFTLEFIKFLYKHPKYLQKSYWFIWGGDLYGASEDEKSVFVRKNMRGILTSFDYPFYKEKYGENKCYDVTYPHAMTYGQVDFSNLPSHTGTNILINNSADETTLEMLDILEKFKDQDINIYTILSYTSVHQKDPRLKIMKKGYEIYGNKFHPLIEFMPENEYAQFLASIDIYISNQNRAQGNGNATFICGLGKKVFTKSDTAIYQKYNSLGITYFDTYTIKDLSFEEFLAYDDKTRERTVSLLRERMKDETKVKQWTEFFLDD